MGGSARWPVFNDRAGSKGEGVYPTHAGGEAGDIPPWQARVDRGFWGKARLAGVGFIILADSVTRCGTTTCLDGANLYNLGFRWHLCRGIQGSRACEPSPVC